MSGNDWFFMGLRRDGEAKPRSRYPKIRRKRAARITIVESGFDKATHEWLVCVDQTGTSRVVATCPYQKYAQVVASGLRKLTDEELGKLYK